MLLSTASLLVLWWANGSKRTRPGPNVTDGHASPTHTRVRGSVTMPADKTTTTVRMYLCEQHKDGRVIVRSAQSLKLPGADDTTTWLNCAFNTIPVSKTHCPHDVCAPVLMHRSKPQSIPNRLHVRQHKHVPSTRNLTATYHMSLQVILETGPSIQNGAIGQEKRPSDRKSSLAAV